MSEAKSGNAIWLRTPGFAPLNPGYLLADTMGSQFSK